MRGQQNIKISDTFAKNNESLRKHIPSWTVLFKNSSGQV